MKKSHPEPGGTLSQIDGIWGSSIVPPGFFFLLILETSSHSLNGNVTHSKDCLKNNKFLNGENAPIPLAPSCLQACSEILLQTSFRMQVSYLMPRSREVSDATLFLKKNIFEAKEEHNTLDKRITILLKVQYTWIKFNTDFPALFCFYHYNTFITPNFKQIT